MTMRTTGRTCWIELELGAPEADQSSREYEPTCVGGNASNALQRQHLINIFYNAVLTGISSRYDAERRSYRAAACDTCCNASNASILCLLIPQPILDEQSLRDRETGIELSMAFRCQESHWTLLYIRAEACADCRSWSNSRGDITRLARIARGIRGVLDR